MLFLSNFILFTQYEKMIKGMMHGGDWTSGFEIDRYTVGPKVGQKVAERSPKVAQKVATAVFT